VTLVATKLVALLQLVNRMSIRTNAISIAGSKQDFLFVVFGEGVTVIFPPCFIIILPFLMRRFKTNFPG